MEKKKIYVYTYLNMYACISKTIISLEMRGWWRQRGSNCLIKIEWSMSNDSNFIDNLKFRPHVICRSAHATDLFDEHSLWNWIVLMNPPDRVNKNLTALHLLVSAWIGGKLNLPSHSFIFLSNCLKRFLNENGLRFPPPFFFFLRLVSKLISKFFPKIFFLFREFFSKIFYFIGIGHVFSNRVFSDWAKLWFLVD